MAKLICNNHMSSEVYRLCMHDFVGTSIPLFLSIPTSRLFGYLHVVPCSLSAPNTILFPNFVVEPYTESPLGLKIWYS